MAALSVFDYVVIAVTLAIPVGMGIFLAIWRRNKNTTEDYLLGNRKLHVVPVTLSLFVTLMSSTSLIGMPAEIYTTGSDFVLNAIGIGISFLASIFTVIPIMHPLRVTSMYEYFGLRFKSPGLRFFVTVVGMFQKILFCSVVLLSPALTLQTAAGLPFWVSCVIVAGVGVIYTSIGGLRGVVIVDVFQAFIIMIGFIAVISKGVIDVGSFEKTWTLAKEGKRIDAVSFDPNPLIRHTFWTLTIGWSFTFFGYSFDQAAVQRVCSIPTMTGARVVYLVNIFAVAVYMVCLWLIGIVAYSYLASQGCDPFQVETVTNRNQIPPYFVLRVFEHLPGLPGLYVATIFSGALSTLSSIINGLAANTIVDILRYPLKRYKIGEASKLLVAKLSVCFYGAVIVGLAFIARGFPGTVIQTTIGLLGALAGPIVGVFFLGGLTPWSNKIGGTVGVVVALGLNAWLSIGGVLYGRGPGLLPPPPGNSCHVIQDSNITVSYNTTTQGSLLSTVEQSESTSSFSLYDISYLHYGLTGCLVAFIIGLIVSLITFLKECYVFEHSESTSSFSLYDISYLHYGLTGCLVAFIIGLIVSLITYKRTPRLTDERLLFPFVRRLWKIQEETNLKDSYHGKSAITPDPRGCKMAPVSLNTRL